MKKIFQFKSGTDKYYPNCYFPVGFIFITIGDKSPASIYGGTWELLKDRFLIGAGDKYSLGATGGEETHVLSESEMPKHRHCFGTANGFTYFAILESLGGSPHATWDTSSGNLTSGPLSETGGSQAHNNMPPYLAVYFWKKISE